MKIKPLKLSLAAILGVAIIAPLSAQDEVIEEVIVTATKRQQTLQEVPVAVSVTDSDTIDKAQILDIADLQSVVPSLRVTQLQSSTNTNFIIRGFGNGANNAGIEPSVGVFIDGVYRSRSAGAISDLPNLQRVEVLRGPQSTLFGKNASAGVISVITAKPSQDLGGSAELTVGNYGLFGLKADLTGGITDDLAFSVYASLNDRDGYFENLANTSDEFNERDRTGFRGQLLYTPTENSEFRLILDKDDLDENCCGVANLLNGPTGAVVTGLARARGLDAGLVAEQPFAYENYFSKGSESKVENQGISLQGDINFNNFDLTSITSYRDQELFFDQDADFGGAALIGNVGLDQDIQTITQEVRLTSTAEGNLDWMVGGFYFKEDVFAAGEVTYGDDITSYVNGLLSPAGVDLVTLECLSSTNAADCLAGTALPSFFNQFMRPGQGTFDFSTQNDEALSLFGQVDYHFGDRGTLTVGLNHTTDEKEVTSNYNVTDVFATVDLFTVNGGLIPQAFFAPAFTDTFNLPATQANIDFIRSLPAGTPGFPPGASGAAIIAGIEAAVAGGIQSIQGLQFQPQLIGFPNSVENGKSDDSATTYTLRYAFDINDTWNAYASYGTGFKATSWNLSRDSRPFPTDETAIVAAGLNQPNQTYTTRFAGPEDSTVIELGVKAKFTRGALNVAVFDQEIDGFQSNTFNGTGFNLTNAGKQSTTGLEVDALFDATDDLTLTFAATLLDPTYDSFITGNGINDDLESIVTDLSGTTPAGVHEISATMSATYNFDLSNGWDGFVRGDYLYESSARINENTPAQFERQVNTLNGSVGIRTESGWDATIWGRNLTDDQYLLSTFPSVAQAGSFNGYPNQPRTYGLSIRKSF